MRTLILFSGLLMFLSCFQQKEDNLLEIQVEKLNNDNFYNHIKNDYEIHYANQLELDKKLQDSVVCDELQNITTFVYSGPAYPVIHVFTQDQYLSVLGLSGYLLNDSQNVSSESLEWLDSIISVCNDGCYYIWGDQPSNGSFQGQWIEYLNDIN